MDRFLTTLQKILIIIIPILLIGNLLVLDVWMWKIWNSLSNQNNQDKPVTFLNQVPGRTDSGFACSVGCISLINEATASMSLRLNDLQKSIANLPTPAPLLKVVTKVQPTAASSKIKEFFIPLGSGSSDAKDWTTVGGVQAYIDNTNYNSIKTVTFEISLRTPTGNQTAWARLINATDGRQIWGSELSIEGGTPKLLISPPITLDYSNKLYAVQMKTQLGFPTNIDQARVHIVTN